MLSPKAPNAFLEVDHTAGATERVTADASVYLEVDASGEEPSDTPAAGRRKSRAAERRALNDDFDWVAVIRALHAERPLLAALWPTVPARDLLRDPPSAEAFAERCEEARRAFDAVGRRDAESRARAEVAQRRLTRQLEELAEVGAPRDAAVQALERAQADDVLSVLRLLADGGRVLFAQDVPRLKAAAAERGLGWPRVLELAREAGLEIHESEERQTGSRAEVASSSTSTGTSISRTPLPGTPWHFAHLGSDYFATIADAHRAAGLPPLVAIWTGRLGVSYDQKACGRQVNPNWMIEVQGGTTYTKRGGFSTPDTYVQANMYRWAWDEIESHFGRDRGLLTGRVAFTDSADAGRRSSPRPSPSLAQRRSSTEPCERDCADRDGLTTLDEKARIAALLEAREDTSPATEEQSTRTATAPSGETDYGYFLRLGLAALAILFLLVKLAS